MGNDLILYGNFKFAAMCFLMAAVFVCLFVRGLRARFTKPMVKLIGESAAVLMALLCIGTAIFVGTMRLRVNGGQIARTTFFRTATVNLAEVRSFQRAHSGYRSYDYAFTMMDGSKTRLDTSLLSGEERLADVLASRYGFRETKTDQFIRSSAGFPGPARAYVLGTSLLTELSIIAVSLVLFFLVQALSRGLGKPARSIVTSLASILICLLVLWSSLIVATMRLRVEEGRIIHGTVFRTVTVDLTKIRSFRRVHTLAQSYDYEFGMNDGSAVRFKTSWLSGEGGLGDVLKHNYGINEKDGR